MKKIFYLFVITAVFLLASCQEDTEPVNTDPTSDGLNFRNYVYNKEYKDDCKLDVYRTETVYKPAVLMIHGSAWMNILDKSSFESNKDIFLNNGYHVVNIDYRKINIFDPTGAQPTCLDMIEDIKSAVKYIYDNSADFMVDTSKLVLFGYSSGAHLAELYAYKVKDTSIPVKLCISKAGPSDFKNKKFRTCDVFGFTTDQNIRNNIVSFIKQYIGFSSDTDDEELAAPFRVFLIKTMLGIDSDETSDINVIADDPQYQDKIEGASPIYYVEANSPSTILLHGKLDTLVDCSMSEDLMEKLKGLRNDEYDKIFYMDHSGHDLSNEQDSAQLNDFENYVAETLRKIK